MSSLSCKPVDFLYCLFLPITCERERLKESLPKDGEMRQPDSWYQTTARYFDEDPSIQDSVLPVPSGSETFLYPGQQSPLYQSAQTFPYTSVVDVPQAPPQEKLPQALQDFIALGSSMPKTADPSFVNTLQSWPSNASQTPQFDPGLYYMPDEPAGSAIDQTTVRNSVSYQTPASSIGTPSGYSLSYGNPPFTVENRQETTPSAFAVDNAALSTFPETHYGFCVAPENDPYLRGNPTAVPRYAERSVSMSKLFINQQ